MEKLDDVVGKIEKKIKNLRVKLVKRRSEMGEQDTPNVSRYVTSTRWAVEQEIEAMDKEIARLENGIRELIKLQSDRRRYSGKYFVSDTFEFLEFGIISRKTKLGQEILEKQHE